MISALMMMFRMFWRSRNASVHCAAREGVDGLAKTSAIVGMVAVKAVVGTGAGGGAGAS